jgi:hypothetical protein
VNVADDLGADCGFVAKCLITWVATIAGASACVGLTLPGMINEPGSFSGSCATIAYRRSNGQPGRTNAGPQKRAIVGILFFAHQLFRSGCRATCKTDPHVPLTT